MNTDTLGVTLDVLTDPKNIPPGEVQVVISGVLVIEGALISVGKNVTVAVSVIKSVMVVESKSPSCLLRGGAAMTATASRTVSHTDAFILEEVQMQRKRNGCEGRGKYAQLGEICSMRSPDHRF